MTWLTPGFWPMVLAFAAGVVTGAFAIVWLWLRWEEKGLLGYRRRLVLPPR
jgi:hypothetical protein